MASKEFIAKLKESIDIVDVVSKKVELRRSGKYLTGLSPFTKEKTPSFFVNPENQSFYCYSSNQGGDVITFLELTQGFSFQEALAQLAEQAGMPLEQRNLSPAQAAQERERTEKKKLQLKLNRFAARFYQEQFSGSEGAIARDYAQKRGITQDSLLAFGIGYAPDSWTALRDYFLKIQAPLLPAYELGLFRTKGGEKPKEDGSNLFDTFRNRLLFPIRDPQGEVVAFGGRWLGSSSAQAPKYLNSPESIVYEKEKLLYNLDQARKSIRELESVVLVEGYMDCLALVQAGFTNVVANCGTALTKAQVALLRKLAPKVICLYDADEAGQAAMDRAMDLFLEEGFPLLGARIPEGKDPDEFLRSMGEGASLKMAEILQNSPALLDTWMEKTLENSPTTLQGRTEVLEKIAVKLAKLKDELWIQARLPNLQQRLGVEGQLLINAIRKHRKGFQWNPAEARSGPKTLGNDWRKISTVVQKNKQKELHGGKSKGGFERRFFSDLLKNPEWIASLRQRHAENPGVILPYVNNPGIRQALLEVLQPLVSGEAEETRLQRLQNTFREQGEIRNLLSQALMKWNDELPPKDLDGALAKLRGDFLRRQAADLQQRIDEAVKRGDTNSSEALLLELTELRKQRAQ